jgi:hypothetical protein
MTATDKNPELKTEVALEQATGVTGPMNWWLVGLVALFALAAMLLIAQLVTGNTGPAVYSGSPVAAPQMESPSAAPLSSMAP